MNPQDIQEEQMRMVRLRSQVDRTSYRLRWTPLSREEALSLIEQTREEIIDLFPSKGGVFDLVLRPRFMRLLDERTMAEWGVLDSIN